MIITQLKTLLSLVIPLIFYCQFSYAKNTRHDNKFKVIIPYCIGLGKSFIDHSQCKKRMAHYGVTLSSISIGPDANKPSDDLQNHYIKPQQTISTRNHIAYKHFDVYDSYTYLGDWKGQHVLQRQVDRALNLIFLDKNNNITQTMGNNVYASIKNGDLTVKYELSTDFITDKYFGCNACSGGTITYVNQHLASIHMNNDALDAATPDEKKSESYLCPLRQRKALFNNECKNKEPHQCNITAAHIKKYFSICHPRRTITLKDIAKSGRHANAWNHIDHSKPN